MTNKTRKYLEERRANKAYWAKRSIEKNDRLISDAEAVAKELEKGYVSASKLIEQEIKKIFRGFENAFDLSEAEAKRLVALSDGKAPSKAIMQAISMISDPDKRKQMLAEVSSGAYKYRIDRLDKLAKQAEAMSKSLYASELRTDRAFLASEMDKAYKHTIFDLQQGTGVSGAFEQLPESRVKQVLNTKWSGKHFSSRIWGNTQVLSDTLRQNMIESFITGEGEREAAARIAERFGVASFRARALIRTENTYVTGQAELEAYRNSAVDKYEYASLDDNRRSLVCERLDGKIFFVKKAKPGVNYPPMHPFCRSSTMAVLPSEEDLDKEWDTFLGDNVPQDMSFEEWLDGLEPAEDGKLVYTGKSGTIPVDITDLYEKSAKPYQGNVSYDEGYNKDLHKTEIVFAEWLHSYFGGNIHLLSESTEDGILMPNFVWNNNLWDLKTVTTEKAANSAIRKGLKQIAEKPGGIILDYGSMEISLETLKAVIQKRMQWYRGNPVDILVINNKKPLIVLRYK